MLKASKFSNKMKMGSYWPDGLLPSFKKMEWNYGRIIKLLRERIFFADLEETHGKVEGNVILKWMR